MQRRYLGLSLCSIVMLLHAVLVGRYLESVFFLVAFPWGWVAFAALLGAVESARTMAMTMVGLLILGVAVLALMEFGAAEKLALCSLALLPAIVSWACLLVYLYHIQSPLADELPSA